MRQEIFRMERVTYKEQEVTFLEDFNLQIYSGEIMGMNPINGHGLPAFLKLLQTNMPLDDGYIYYCGKKINSWNDSQKTPNRISIIEDKSRLVENMTVADNIFVLRQGFRQEIIRPKLLKKQLSPFLEDIGMEIPVDEYVENLSVFQRVIVELLRAVVMGHRLIVLNEIGMLISYEELEKLHRILHHYAGQGFAFLYICLHLEEIGEVCDRAALLSNGRIQKIIRQNEMMDEIVKVYSEEYIHMVQSHKANRQSLMEEQSEILRVEGLCGECVTNISFGVRKGECLVIQTLDNGMFYEMEQILMYRRRPEAGALFIEGKKTDFSYHEAVAVIQELPTKFMVFPELSYMDNLCMSLFQRIPSVRGGKKIRSSIRQEYASVLGEEVFSTPVEELSEEQRYQMVYTRVLLQKPRVVFCFQPFKGADLHHRMFVWKQLERLLDKGIAVVILTLNFSDSLSLADRLLQMDAAGGAKEIRREEFSTISLTAPWLHFYRDSEK